jgi:hypothetical protein
MTYASFVEYLCIKMIHGAYLHRDFELVALLCFIQIFKCYCYVKVPVLEFQSIEHGFVAYHRLFRICFFLDSIVLLRLPCKIIYCTNSLHGASTYLLFFLQSSSSFPPSLLPSGSGSTAPGLAARGRCLHVERKCAAPRRSVEGLRGSVAVTGGRQLRLRFALLVPAAQ